jgi:hypothetical protein
MDGECAYLVARKRDEFVFGSVEQWGLVLYREDEPLQKILRYKVSLCGAWHFLRKIRSGCLHERAGKSREQEMPALQNLIRVPVLTFH